MRLVLSSLMMGALAIGCAGSLFAQHVGGGGHSGGAHAPASPAGGFRQFHGAVPPAGPAPIGINPGALRPGRGYFGGGTGGRGSGERGGNHRHREYGYVAGGYLYAPYYGYSDYSSVPYDNGYGYGPSDDVSQQSADITANMLGDQIQRLSAEVQELRDSQQGYGPPPAQQYAAPAPAQPDPPTEPITVVLKTGQQLKVQSYAVMDDKFWDFSKQPARRIELSDIDLAASTKATAATGGEFPELR